MKRYGIGSLLLVVLTIGVWWRLKAPPQLIATIAPHLPAPVAKPSETAKQAAAQPPVAKTPAIPVTAPPSAAVRLWGALRSEEGSPLDDRKTSAARKTGAVAVGRVVVYDRNTQPLGTLQPGQAIIIPLPGGAEARGIVDLNRIEPDGSVHVGGGLTDGTIGTFSIVQNGGRLGGRVLMRSKELAYLVSTLSTGEVLVKELALGDIICQPFPRIDTPEPAPVLATGPAAAPPELRSRPGAVDVFFLDFDGAVVTDPDWDPAPADPSINTITAAPSSLNAAQITEVWTRVKEDYWPFPINVTTVESDYTSAPVGRRMRVIITPTNSASPSSGGIAYVDSFSGAGVDFSSDIPCWVFNSSVDAIVETISHELGHTLGLHHDGRLAPNAVEYYTGHGSTLSWGPIMGSSFNVLVTQWSKGEYPGANNQEDDLAILSGQQPTPLSVASGKPVTNNTGYVVDDIGSSRERAVPLDVSSYTINATGVISDNTDSDYFTFSVPAPRKLSFNATPSNTYYRHANLDVQVELQDANGAVLMVLNPETSLNASLATTVSAGTYFLRVSGGGHAASPASGDYGYSNYGSLGPYTLAGTLGDVVAPSITANPQGNSLYASQNVTLSATAIGTAPLVYQWKKDGNPVSNDSRITGATTASLSINNLATSDAGNYTLAVSNGAGSVSTAAATLVVTMPSVPSFYYPPSSTTVVEGNYLSLSAYATSPVNVTYQWYRDGLPLTNQTGSYLSISPVRPSDAGNYWVVATNVAGSTTSATAVVTVNAATLPTITAQPHSAELYTGQYYSLYVSATSTGPLSFQWYRNGSALANTNSSGYSISNASASHAGTYSVAVTSPAGTVMSSSAEITVSSTLPPRITSQPSSYNYASSGSSAYFSVGAEGMGPLTYRWYRNGVQVPSGTSSSLYINPVSASDVGEYYVTVSNANGTVQSDTVILDFSPNYTPDSYWYETREVDGVVYFLFKNSGKIARYDLATESWLPAWNLIYAPTAFTVSADAVYVAFGTTIKKYSRSFTNETVLATTANGVIWLESTGSVLITASMPSYAYTSLTSFNATSGAQIDTKTFVYSAGQGFTFNPATSSVYGRTTAISPGDIHRIPVSNGIIGADTESPYHGAYPEGVRTFLLKDGTLVSDNGGVVYDATNLTFRGSFGSTLKDAVPAGDGYCSLTGTRLNRYDENFRQIGTTRIPVYGARLSRRGNTLYTFVQPTTATSQPTVHKTDIALLVPEPPAPALSAYGRKVTPDQIVMDETGIVYVYNKDLRNIFRWSTGTRQYLPSIPLVTRPRFLAYSAPNRALYFDNGSTQVKRIEIDGNLAEDPFYNTPQPVQGLQAAGGKLMVVDPSGAWSTHYVLSASGTLLDSKEWNYYSREYTWSTANDRLYFFRDDTSPNDLHFETISNAGLITGAGETPYHGEVSAILPIRVNPDGSRVLLGSGQLYDGTNMTRVGTLVAHTDSAWSNGRWHTIQPVTGGTKLQSWSPSDLSAGPSIDLAGTPLRLFALPGERMLVITSVQGYLQYWEIDSAGLSVNNRTDTTAFPVRSHADFNGDGRSDILWRNTATGAVGAWLMNGTAVASYLPLGSVGPEYVLVGTGDFNGDGRSDILWRNTASGEVGAWLMNGATVMSYASLGTVGPELMVAGTGDFNADGKTDVLWRNRTTGAVGAWLMNGTTVASYAAIGSAGLELAVAGTGDFNGDGKTDILWRNRTTGAVTAWLMNGTTIVSTAGIGSAGVELLLAGTGDYNQDGNTDILWRNTNTGEVGAWLMNGTTVSSYVTLGSAGLELALSGFGEPVRAKRGIVDFNGDGKTDILWRNNTTGDVGAWLMNGTTVSSYVPLGSVGTSWSIAGTGDVDEDGQADILWRNPANDVGVWYMRGTSIDHYTSLGNVGPGWAIAGTADFDGDGETDILWRNTNTGDVGAWLISNTSTRYVAIGTVGVSWTIAGTGDFNGDGKVDILWRDLATGDVGVWRMNGTTVSGYTPIGSVGTGWAITGTGDFNGDGKVDILWRDTTTGDVGLWRMNGTTVSGYTFIGSVGLTWSIKN